MNMDNINVELMLWLLPNAIVLVAYFILVSRVASIRWIIEFTRTIASQVKPIGTFSQNSAPETRDPYRSYIDAEMTNRRLSRARRCVSLFAHLFAIFGVWGIAHRLDSRRAPNGLDNAIAQILFFIMSLICFVLNMFPRFLHAKNIYLWYSLAMFLKMGYLATLSKPELVYHADLFLMMRFALSLVVLRTPIIALWNVIYSFLATSLYIYQINDSCGLPLPVGFLCRELAISIVFLGFVIRHLETSMDREIREAIMRADISKREHRAQESLLNAFCDAVVQLDASHCIAIDTPKLNTLLLHDPGRSLSGIPFRQFAHGEESAMQMEEYFATPPVDGEHLARMFPLDLRDTMGTRIRVDVIHANLLHVHGKEGHLLGIRERVDDDFQSRQLGAPLTPSHSRESSRTNAASINHKGGNLVGIPEQAGDFQSPLTPPYEWPSLRTNATCFSDGSVSSGSSRGAIGSMHGQISGDEYLRRMSEFVESAREDATEGAGSQQFLGTLQL